MEMRRKEASLRRKMKSKYDQYLSSSLSFCRIALTDLNKLESLSIYYLLVYNLTRYSPHQKDSRSFLFHSAFKTRLRLHFDSLRLRAFIR